MCMNCLSTAETVAATAAFVGYAAKPRLHRALARLDVVNPPDPVAHDVTTVAFLRSLDLDPVEVLGADVVAAAEAWTAPQPAPGSLPCWPASPLRPGPSAPRACSPPSRSRPSSASVTGATIHGLTWGSVRAPIHHGPVHDRS